MELNAHMHSKVTLSAFIHDPGDKQTHRLTLKNLLWYRQHHKHLQSSINGYILQAPVSDREYICQEPKFEQHYRLAKDMIARGQADELMPRECNVAPITAYRFDSLAGRWYV